MANAESTPIQAVRESRAAARVDALVAQVPLGLAIVLAAGVVLRLVVSLVYQPALMNSADSPTYVVMADGGLFGDPVRTAGYPMFMIALHWVSDALAFTITVQHVLGVLTALLLYVIARRVGAPLWVATIGAAAVLLSLDQVVLEHIILSEALFTFLFVATLYACVRALDDPSPLYRAFDSRHAWLFAAGLLLALCAWVRGVAAPLSPFLLLWILLAIPGSWRRRVVNAAVAAIAIAALMLTYFALNDARTGTFGLSQSPGWALYSRIAPIADCHQFTPPEGTESLCEATPPGARNGPDFYGWESGSPAIKLFTYPPNGDDELGAFAREAIRAQPRGYVQAVGTDVLRYFFPNYKTYPFGGLGYHPLDIQYEDLAIERDVWSYLSAVYTGVDQRKIEEPVTVLSEIQDWMRVQPLLMLAAVALAVAGIVFTRGRVRAVLVLLCGAGLLLFVIPSATATYNARYAIPSGGPLMLAGAMAAWALLSRLRGTRDEAMPGSPRSHEAG